MKTIGMIGGMSWESSLEYYRIINETVKARLGGLHSAKSLLFSFDFEEIEALQMAGDWAKATEMMVQAAWQLERGGADFVIICTNTMHKMAEDVQAAIDIPLLHIADATATAIQTQGLHKIGLLGTNFTMEEDFYRGRLEQKFGLEVIVPERPERQVVHDIIYDELCLGLTKADSRAQYRQIMADLAAAGAEGIILGCTEIGLLVNQEDSPVPLFDTTVIHAETAVTYALQP
jgi:aspartate racemase